VLGLQELREQNAWASPTVNVDGGSAGARLTIWDIEPGGKRVSSYPYKAVRTPYGWT